MILIIIGILLGALLGLWLPLGYFPDGNIYMTGLIFILLDMIFVLLKQNLSNDFTVKKFSIKTIVNIFITALLIYAGVRFEVPIYYGCYFAFAYRIYNNINDIVEIKFEN